MTNRPRSTTCPPEDRRAAAAFIVSITAARGVDPYASRPSIEPTPRRWSPVPSTAFEAIGRSLQAQLRVDVDPGALVVSMWLRRRPDWRRCW